MSDPISPATVYPERHTPEALAANAKPKRKGRGKAAPSKPPRAKPAAPVRTLRRRIEDLGHYHLEAYDRRRKSGGEAYEEQVRAALDARDQLSRASARNDQARAALAQAAVDLVDAEEVEQDSRPVLDRLFLDAKTLASLDRDDVEPDSPLPTSALRHEQGNADETAVG